MNIDGIEKLLKEGKVEDALKIVKKEAKGKDDDYAEIFLKAGTMTGETADIIQEKGEYTLAMNYLKLAKKISKDKKLTELVIKNQSTAHNNLGILLEKQLKRRKEAEDEFRKAIKINPKNIEAHKNLGNSLMNLKKYGEAEDEFIEVLSINPEDAGAYYSLGILYEHNDRRIRYGKGFKINNAINAYRISLKINPEQIEAHTNLGVLLGRHLKRYKKAEAEFQEAIRINPEIAEIHLNLGHVLIGLKKYVKAEEEYKKAFNICSNLKNKKHIARSFCILSFSFFGQGKIEEHKNELEKIKVFFKDNNDAKEFLVDACNSYRSSINYFLSKDYAKSKNKLEDTISYLEKSGEKEISEVVVRTKELILLDEKFNDLMCLISVLRKDEILERISNISNDTERLSEKGFIIEEFINHYIFCVKTFDECFDMFRYEKPIDIDIEELSKNEDFFVNFGFSVDKNPANGVIRIASKINECSNKINKNPENKKEIFENYWNVKIKELLPSVLPELNGFAIGNMINNMINNETQKQTTELLKTLSEPIMRIDMRTERTETKVDEVLKIAKSTEKTIDYIKGYIEKASSENKEILETLINLTEKYEKSDGETRENLNYINCVLAKLVSEEDAECIKQIAEELTNKENEKEVIELLKDGDNKSGITSLFEKLKDKVEKLPEDVAKEGYKKLVIAPITEAIIDLLKQCVEKSPEVIPVLLQIMRAAPTLTAVML
jgi:tetratricopeptide (TPR) repeat protein